MEDIGLRAAIKHAMTNAQQSLQWLRHERDAIQPLPAYRETGRSLSLAITELEAALHRMSDAMAYLPPSAS